MKIAYFHNDAYANHPEAKFSFRDDGGLWIHFYCEKLNASRKTIRRAWALCIRGRVIPAEWKLDEDGEHWTLYVPNNAPMTFRPGPAVPSHEVDWALSTNRQCADVETYGTVGVTGWRIVRTVKQCKHKNCPVLFEPTSNNQEFCGKCWERVIELMKQACDGKRASLRKLEHFMNLKEVSERAERDRSANRRWVRESVAEGSYTPSEFRDLCERYGSVCLCCRKKCILTADHVIPFAKRGRGDISNIQPLCLSCNSRKGTDSIDYRLAFDF